MTDRDWSTYVARYHATRPGITETALDHARSPEAGTAHDWLADGIPGPHGDVLDVACGSAPLYPRLSVASYLGVDLSEPELDLAGPAGAAPSSLRTPARYPFPTRAWTRSSARWRSC